MTATEAQTLLTAMRGAHIALDGLVRRLNDKAMEAPELMAGLVAAADVAIEDMQQVLNMMDKLC